MALFGVQVRARVSIWLWHWLSQREPERTQAVSISNNGSRKAVLVTKPHDGHFPNSDCRLQRCFLSVHVLGLIPLFHMSAQNTGQDVPSLAATLATVKMVFFEKLFHEDFFLERFFRKGVSDGRSGSLSRLRGLSGVARVAKLVA